MGLKYDYSCFSSALKYVHCFNSIPEIESHMDKIHMTPTPCCPGFPPYLLHKPNYSFSIFPRLSGLLFHMSNKPCNANQPRQSDLL
jgi:hypothetical protein